MCDNGCFDEIRFVQRQSTFLDKFKKKKKKKKTTVPFYTSIPNFKRFGWKTKKVTEV